MTADFGRVRARTGWRATSRGEVGLGGAEDFEDGEAVGGGEVGEGGRLVLVGQDFEEAAVDVLFREVGEGVELGGVDQVAARIFERPALEVEVAEMLILVSGFMVRNRLSANQLNQQISIHELT
jgi:hypothetical protein